MRVILYLLIVFPFLCNAQDYIIKEGVPADLAENKIIFLSHEKIVVTAVADSSEQQAYLHLRQTNHNNVIKESNSKLKVAALEYPFPYVITNKSNYESLVKAGYKYLLDSRAYSYDNLAVQPAEDELIVYEFFIRDLTTNVAYKVFELDEMKIYDGKLIVKRLNKAVKKEFPNAF